MTQQLHTSYSSLGRDFKAIFEELVKHVNTQKAEADELRSQISTATRSAIRAEAAMSSHLESVLNEERAQAAEDRQNLLSQISLLVTKSGEAQDARWQSKVNEIKIEITSSRSDLESAESKYNDSMSVWSEKENLLVEEVVKSRESLKSRMKKDWTVSCWVSGVPLMFFTDNSTLRPSTNETQQSRQPRNRFMRRPSA